jgi:hypothetical protein
MQTKGTVDGAAAPQSPDSTLTTLPAVAQRSARRGKEDQHKGDVEGRIVEYLKDHRQATRNSPTAR